MTDTKQFLRRMNRIESLVRQLEAATDPTLRLAAQNLVQSLLELHAEALKKLMGKLDRDEPGRRMRDVCAADDLIGSVLLLHDLHPWPLEKRVERAMEQLQAAVNRQDGELELQSVSPQRIQLRYTPGGGGCGSTAKTAEELIRATLRDKAPEVAMIEIEGAQEPAPLIQLTVNAK